MTLGNPIITHTSSVTAGIAGRDVFMPRKQYEARPKQKWTHNTYRHNFEHNSKGSIQNNADIVKPFSQHNSTIFQWDTYYLHM